MLEQDETAVPRRSGQVRAAIGELALVLSWPLMLAVIWVLGDYAGPLWIVALVPAWVLFWAYACLGAFARSDPIGFISIVGPPFVVSIAALALGVAGRWVAAIAYAPLIWVLAWTFAGSLVWPPWSRVVLRRFRPGSPEVELFKAWGDVLRLWQSASTAEEGQAVWAGLNALQRWETTRTRPVIDGLFAWWELASTPGAERSEVDRLTARLREEGNRLWAPPRVRLPGRGVETTDRPTRATRLEYLFPRLEALLAVASPDQQRRIAAESARLALRGAALATPELEKALDEVASGRPDPDTRREVEARLLTVREARDATPHSADVDDTTWQRLALDAVALSAAVEALGDELSPATVADVVYESLRSESDRQRAMAFERVIADIVGPDAAARAVVIEPVATTSGKPGDSSAGHTEADSSILGGGAHSRRGLVRIAGVGFIAGFAGTLLRQLAWPILEGLPYPSAIDLGFGLVIVALAGYGLTRVWFGRPSFDDTMLLYIGSLVADLVAGALFDVSSNLVAPLGGAAWTEFFADPTNVAPLAPFYGLAFAATLVAGSLLLARRDAAIRAYSANAG